MGLFDAIGSILGTNTDFRATGIPVSGPAINATADRDLVYNTSPENQAAFLSAIGNANGIGNQSKVFNQQMGLAGQQQGLLGQQQGLANQLQQQAAGGGPNPALQQLAMTTGQNMRGQSAMMASQRGAGRNAGLMGRQAAMQGGAIQQQAVGQAGLMRAQQQLAAQQALAQQQMNMGAMTNNIGNTQMGAGSIATNQVGQLQQALQNQANFALNRYNIGVNAGTNLMQQQIAQNNAMQGLNAGINQGNAQMNTGLVLGAAGAATKAGQGMAHGGQVKRSSLCEYAMSQGGKIGGVAKVEGDSSSNDTVPAMLSPGEVVIPRSKVKDERKIAAFLNSLLGTSLMPGGK